MENRNGLAVGGDATLATGTAEREAAASSDQGPAEGATLGADKNYDAEAFVEDLKPRKIEPHIAINGTVSKLGKVRKTAVPPEVAASTRLRDQHAYAASGSRKVSAGAKSSAASRN